MGEYQAREISLEEELIQRARQQAVVAELGQRALLGTDLHTLMDEIARQVSQTLQVEYCKVFELQPDGHSLLLVAGVGWKPGLVGKAMLGAGLNSQAGFTLSSNEPVIVEDLRTETRFHGSPLLLDHSVVSGISVIVRGRDHPFGVIGAHTTSLRKFSQDDVNFLQSIANLLAAAIDRKHVEEILISLNNQLEKRVAERGGYTRLLQEVSTAANQAVSVETAFHYALDRICAFTGWQVGHVYMLSKNGRTELSPTDIWHFENPDHYQAFRKETENTRLNFGEGLPGTAAQQREPVCLKDILSDSIFLRSESAVQSGIHSAFAFPVMVGNQAAAVLEFFSNEITEPDKPFLDLMSNIGTQLGRVVEREQAEEELRHSQEQLAEAQKIASIGSWDWDLSARSVHWSEEIYRIYGVKPGEFKADYEGFMQMIHPDDREAITREANRAIQERKPYNIEHRIFRPDGSQRTIYAQGNLILDEDNQPVKMVGICQDITERREMEEALRESLFMFENLFESAPDGTVLVDQDGLILRANRQIEDIFGYQRTELIGKPLETLLPDRYRIGHSLRRGSFSKDPQLRPMGAGLELYGRRSDGTEFPVDIMLSPLKTDQGLQVIAVVRDITERRRAEEALRQSEARFRSVFEGNAFGMAVVDLKGRILLSNPRLSEILGYPQAELRVLTSSSLTFPADIHATEKMYQDMLEGRQDATQLEKRYIRKDGQVIWARLTISLVRNSNDAPHFAIAMVEDITSRKQMEAELAEVKHRLMVGREQERIRLAQELHDAPLQDLYVVLYQLNDLEESIGDPEQFRQLKNSQAETIRQVISTLRSIMGELRSPTLSPFGLAGAIREHSEQFQAKFPLLMLHLDLENDDQDLSEEVRLNLFRIYQQALTNVIRHAQAQNVTIRFSYNENKIVLEIEDDGLGFEVPARWLRLAREGHLGLAGASERAEMMGGRLQVISKPGKGTLLRVEVPRKFEPIL